VGFWVTEMDFAVSSSSSVSFDDAHRTFPHPGELSVKNTSFQRLECKTARPISGERRKLTRGEPIVL